MAGPTLADWLRHCARSGAVCELSPDQANECADALESVIRDREARIAELDDIAATTARHRLDMDRR